MTLSILIGMVSLCLNQFSGSLVSEKLFTTNGTDTSKSISTIDGDEFECGTSVLESEETIAYGLLEDGTSVDLKRDGVPAKETSGRSSSTYSSKDSYENNDSFSKSCCYV